MKENKAFRILFITKKTIKKQKRFIKNVLETPIQSIQRCLNPQHILFLCSLYFKNISTPSLEPTNGKVLFTTLVLLY